jgi:hypothetical protein
MDQIKHLEEHILDLEKNIARAKSDESMSAERLADTLASWGPALAQYQEKLAELKAKVEKEADEPLEDGVPEDE